MLSKFSGPVLFRRSKHVDIRFLSEVVVKIDKPKCLTVALVGRPNVGKSTLFNRLTRTNLAIVSPVPGTTRDRKEGRGHLAGLPLLAIDTGGFDDRGTVKEAVQKQVQMALKSSDVILFMIDAKDGLTSLDSQFSKWLRQSMGKASAHNGIKDGNKLSSSPSHNRKQIIMVANKTEGAHLSDRVLNTISDALGLGFGNPVLISASHGDGIAELSQVLLEAAKLRGFDIGESGPTTIAEAGITLEERTIQLAVMGKPVRPKSHARV